MTTREQLAAECKRLADRYRHMDGLWPLVTKRELHAAIDALSSWQPEQQAAEPTHYASPLTGRAVRAEWLKSGATERDQDEYTIPLYTRPTDSL